MKTAKDSIEHLIDATIKVAIEVNGKEPSREEVMIHVLDEYRTWADAILLNKPISPEEALAYYQVTPPRYSYILGQCESLLDDETVGIHRNKIKLLRSFFSIN